MFFFHFIPFFYSFCAFRLNRTPYIFADLRKRPSVVIASITTRQMSSPEKVQKPCLKFLEDQGYSKTSSFGETSPACPATSKKRGFARLKHGFSLKTARAKSPANGFSLSKPARVLEQRQSSLV
jgi:hypothetical protein